MPLAAECLTRAGLRDLAVATLLAANTDAGANVFQPRDWPTASDGAPPALMVQTPSEQKESLARGLPQFFSTIMLVVLGRTIALDPATAETALDRLLAQVEEAIFCTPAMCLAVQQFSHVDIELTVTAQGESHVAEGYLMIGCEVYQRYEPNGGDPLTELDSTVPPGTGTGAPITFKTILPQP